MDTNLVLRDGASLLTGDESLTAVVVGPMTRPMTLNMSWTASAASDYMDVELEFNDDGSTQIDNMNMKQQDFSVAGFCSIPFYTHHKYLLVKLNETGSVSCYVKVWLSPVARYDAIGDS